MAGGGGGVVKDTAEWELVSGRRAYAKVVRQARVEVVNRFAVLSGGEKVREETCVIGDSIVRLVDDVVCRKGPPEVRADLFAWRWHPGRTQSGGKCGGTWERGGSVGPCWDERRR